MKLNTLRTYKTAFAALSTVFIIYVVCSLLFIAGLLYYYNQTSSEGFKSIWIVDPKSSAVFNAKKADNGLNNPQREFEYRNHVITFYKYWFEQDQFSYRTNIELGLNLLGNCGKTMLAKYDNENFGKKLAEYNLKTNITVDSILFDMSSNPVKGIAFVRQTITSPGGQTERYINAKFQMFDLNSRSNKNPHAVLIENFEFLNTAKIEKQQ